MHFDVFKVTKFCVSDGAVVEAPQRERLARARSTAALCVG